MLFQRFVPNFLTSSKKGVTSSLRKQVAFALMMGCVVSLPLQVFAAAKSAPAVAGGGDACQPDAKRAFIALVDYYHEVVLVQASYKSQNGQNKWMLPGGGCDHKGESNLDCAMREFVEETTLYAGQKSTKEFVTAFNEGVKGSLVSGFNPVAMNSPSGATDPTTCIFVFKTTRSAGSIFGADKQVQGGVWDPKAIKDEETLGWSRVGPKAFLGLLSKGQIRPGTDDPLAQACGSRFWDHKDCEILRANLGAAKKSGEQLSGRGAKPAKALAKSSAALAKSSAAQSKKKSGGGCCAGRPQAND